MSTPSALRDTGGGKVETVKNVSQSSTREAAAVGGSSTREAVARAASEADAFAQKFAAISGMLMCGTFKQVLSKVLYQIGFVFPVFLVLVYQISNSVAVAVWWLRDGHLSPYVPENHSAVIAQSVPCACDGVIAGGGGDGGLRSGRDVPGAGLTDGALRQQSEAAIARSLPPLVYVQVPGNDEDALRSPQAPSPTHRLAEEASNSGGLLCVRDGFEVQSTFFNDENINDNNRTLSSAGYSQLGLVGREDPESVPRATSLPPRLEGGPRNATRIPRSNSFSVASRRPAPRSSSRGRQSMRRVASNGNCDKFFDGLWAVHEVAPHTVVAPLHLPECELAKPLRGAPLPLSAFPLQMFLWPAMPAALDVLGTLGSFVSLQYLPVSVTEVIYCGTGLILTALLATCLRGHRLTPLQWLSVAVTALGTITVTSSQLLIRGSPPAASPSAAADGTGDVSRGLIGVALTIVRVLMAALVDLSEEMVLHDYRLDSLLLVGLEGVYGSIIMVVVIVPLAAAVGFESFSTACSALSLAVVRDIFFFAFFSVAANVANTYVCQLTDCVTRNLWKSLRPVCVWLTMLALYYYAAWEGYTALVGEAWDGWVSALRLVGIALLVVGLNGYVRFKSSLPVSPASPAPVNSSVSPLTPVPVPVPVSVPVNESVSLELAPPQ